MSSRLPPHPNGSSDLAATNQALCREMSALFMLLMTELINAVSRTAGRRLAKEFEQQLNLHAAQHAWSHLTGLAELTELRRRVPDVDAKVLFSVYVSYSQYAQLLAGRILGAQLLRSTLVGLADRLPPDLAEFNVRHRIIPLP